MNDRIYSPHNTASDPAEVRLLASLDIPSQERQGQAQLLSSTTLPTDTRGRDADFEALGFTFGKPVDGDPLFREATLPEGWTREGTDHAMHSVIKDERGIDRVNIFYKAAYYDRRADMSLLNVGWRFVTEWIYSDETPEFHPLFTREELEAIQAAAENERKQVDECPQVYEKNLPRIESLLAAIGAKLAS
jgi:hypothetical protein